MRINQQFLCGLTFVVLLFSDVLANERKKEEIPLIESTELEILYSDEGVVVAKILTPKCLQYENGDSVYPAGVYVECYDKEKKLTGTLRANTVYEYANQDRWELRGDVEVKSFQDGQKQLNTEELYWNVKTKQIYTPKFVRIETENELLTGYGLDADQDLIYYNIVAPQGFVNVDKTEIE